MKLPSAGTRITGAAGAVTSTVKVTGALVGEGLPAGSVATAVTVCGPSPSGVVGVTENVPPGVAVTPGSGVPSTVTTTVEPGSAVPEMVGVGSLTVPPSAGAVMTGALGAVASIVNRTGCSRPRRCPPRRSHRGRRVGTLGQRRRVERPGPAGGRRRRADACPSTRTPTVAPASAVPLIVGVVSLVTLPSAGTRMTGAAGAVASTVKVTGALAGDGLPAASVATAVAVCEPSVRGVVGVTENVPPGVARHARQRRPVHGHHHRRARLGRARDRRRRVGDRRPGDRAG